MRKPVAAKASRTDGRLAVTAPAGLQSLALAQNNLGADDSAAVGIADAVRGHTAGAVRRPFARDVAHLRGAERARGGSRREGRAGWRVRAGRAGRRAAPRDAALTELSLTDNNIGPSAASERPARPPRPGHTAPGRARGGRLCESW
eukprot:gene4435-9736_t